jgi:hypothetical protein
MANIITVDETQPQEKFRTVRYKVAIQAGNYVQAVRGSNVGEVLSLGAALNPKNKPNSFWGKDGPDVGYPLQGPAGFGASIIPGADGLHWLLKIWASAGVEHAAAAYEAAITGDLDFFVEFAAPNFR